MKTFHYQLGHESGSTMIVEELIAELSKYPKDMPVFGTWESVKGFVTLDGFSVEKVHKGDVLEECDCLLIDVERYY